LNNQDIANTQAIFHLVRLLLLYLGLLHRIVGDEVNSLIVAGNSLGLEEGEAEGVFVYDAIGLAVGVLVGEAVGEIVGGSVIADEQKVM
jgi:hypothetical protein